MLCVQGSRAERKWSAAHESSTVAHTESWLGVNICMQVWNVISTDTLFY